MFTGTLASRTAVGSSTSRQTGRPADADVAVTSVEVEGSRVSCSLDLSPRMRQYFTGDDFYVEYDVDVSDVPEGVLTIPVLAQICPVAWTAGADVWAPAVDRRFLDGLRQIGAVFREMYPSFVEGGRVIAGAAPEFDDGPEASAGSSEGSVAGPERSVAGSEGSVAGSGRGSGDPTSDSGRGDDGSDAGLLFTGGVDSLASYVRHRDEDPTLINVRGWLVGAEDDRWRHAKAAIERYGDRFDAETQFIRSNMLEFIETSTLSVEYTDEIPGGWYSAVGGGLGMLGLCAPLAVARGMDVLYVAATHWEGFPVPDEYDHWDGPAMPWGSHPDIDERVAWEGTDVVHDGFELSRQERVEVIADFVADGHGDLPLRACESSAGADNCNRCEKCFRTAMGLAFAGLDPNDHGFDLDTADWARAREQLGSGAWLPDHQEYAYWQEFRRLAEGRQSLPVENDEELLAWLRATRFESVAGRPYSDRLLRAVGRTLPYPLFARARRAYSLLAD